MGVPDDDTEFFGEGEKRAEWGRKFYDILITGRIKLYTVESGLKTIEIKMYGCAGQVVLLGGWADMGSKLRFGTTTRSGSVILEKQISQIR
jgi:hypothetical protein